MQRVPRDRINAELAKADERLELPLPVWVWLTVDAAELAGEVLAWSENPSGYSDGRRGLVLAVRQISPDQWAQYLGWVRAEHIRRRS